jgi:DNA-binding transcriptional LysR family regulator
VSQQLAKLEIEVGVPLLAHVGRGVVLTHAGRLLAQRGRSILSAMAEAKHAVASLERETIGELRIGSFPSACRDVLPGAISELRRHHPALHVSYSSETTDALLAALQRNDVDLVVAESMLTMPLRLPNDVAHEHLCDDVVEVALPKGHRHAAGGSVTLTDLADMTWVTWRRGELFHSWLEHTLRKADVEPKIPFEVPDFSAQFELVASGLGAALIPRLIRAWAPHGVAVVPVEPTLKREILALTKRGDGRPSVRAGINALARAFTSAGPREFVSASDTNPPKG